MVKKKSKNKKKTIRIPKIIPKTGDLVYCHCIGNKYGWFMDKMGLITEKNKSETSDYYTVYMLDTQKSVFVNPNDFVETKVEVVSGYTKEQIDELKERRANVENMLGNLDETFLRR